MAGAGIGCKYPVYGTYSCTSGTVSHTSGKVLGKAVKVSATYEKNDVKLYADDGLVESDTSFKSGKLTAEIYGLSLEDRATLLGHTALAESAVGFTGKSTDTAPYVGFGFYAKRSDNKYVAIFYSKVKFSEPKDEMETKGETTAYKNTELEADIMVDDTDEFIEVQEFATESAAKTYLDGKVGISTAG